MLLVGSLIWAASSEGEGEVPAEPRRWEPDPGLSCSFIQTRRRGILKSVAVAVFTRNTPIFSSTPYLYIDHVSHLYLPHLSSAFCGKSKCHTADEGGGVAGQWYQNVWCCVCYFDLEVRVRDLWQRTNVAIALSA